MGIDEEHERLMRGLFIIFEGIDGSGKSTTIAEIHRRLTDQGISSVMLREPTEKTDASREIRRILRTATEITENVSQELLELFLIDRLWDVRTQVEPAIRAGSVVLMDRYYISTAAYQAKDLSQTRKVMTDYFAEQGILTPDMLVYLKLPVKAALARLTKRSAKDVFETEARLTGISGRYSEAVKIFQEKYPKVTILELDHELQSTDYAMLASQISTLRQVMPG